MSPPTQPCVFCAFPVPTRTETTPDQSDRRSSRCPVCLDGEQDPWAIIRAIRAQISGVSGEAVPEAASLQIERSGDEPLDIFETDVSVLRDTADALWPRLRLSDTDAPMDASTIMGGLQLWYGHAEWDARHLTERFLEQHEDFHGQWELVAESAARRWPRLSRPDLDRIEPTVGGLAALISVRYKLSLRAARKDVISLLSDLHFPEVIRLPNPRRGEGDAAGGSKGIEQTPD